MRKLRVALTIAAPLIACVWLAAYTLRGSSQPYSSGPLSSAHKVFGNNCAACHGQPKGLFQHVSFKAEIKDRNCLACHSSPIHQTAQTFTPKCADCHDEHHGDETLRDVADERCVQCHRDLHIKTGTPRFEPVVSNFVHNHPEFRPLRNGGDPGTIALNHEAHMSAGIRGPHGNVQMECQDCHRAAADAAQRWAYSLASIGGTPTSAADAQPHLVSAALEKVSPSVGRALMAPIRYDQQCAACHQLQFDERISDLVPHGKPEIIHDFVTTKYREYLRAHPQAWREAPRPVRHIPGVQPPPTAHSPEEWISLQAAQAEMLLWRKNCKLCHTIDYVAGKPTVRSPDVPARWLPNAIFNHYAHQAVACDSCHVKSRTSKQTSDVLIPGIDTCRKCHNDSTAQAGSAGDRCSLCHQYHDWSKQPAELKGSFTIKQLLQ